MRTVFWWCCKAGTLDSSVQTPWLHAPMVPGIVAALIFLWEEDVNVTFVFLCRPWSCVSFFHTDPNHTVTVSAHCLIEHVQEGSTAPATLGQGSQNSFPSAFVSFGLCWLFSVSLTQDKSHLRGEVLNWENVFLGLDFRKDCRAFS